MFLLFGLHQPLVRSHSRFFLLYRCCPFLSSDCSSFLETSFLTSLYRIQLAFKFGCLILLFSILKLFSFHVWCLFFFVCFSWWFLFGFLLIVVFTYLFISGVSLLRFCFNLFLFQFVFVLLWLHLLFWFQIMTKQKMFSLRFCFFWGVLQYQFGSRCSASICWSCGIHKNKVLHNGTRFFLLRQRCIKFCLFLTGRGGALN